MDSSLSLGLPNWGMLMIIAPTNSALSLSFFLVSIIWWPIWCCRFIIRWKYLWSQLYLSHISLLQHCKNSNSAAFLFTLSTPTLICRLSNSIMKLLTSSLLCFISAVRLRSWLAECQNPCTIGCYAPRLTGPNTYHTRTKFPRLSNRGWFTVTIQVCYIWINYDCEYSSILFKTEYTTLIKCGAWIYQSLYWPSTSGKADYTEGWQSE